MDITKLKFDIDDLSSLESANYAQIEAFLPIFNKDQGFSGSTRLTLREQIAPAEVFLYLLGRFGSPNGFLSHMRKAHAAVGAEILWHYTLSWRGRLLHVVAHSFRLEVVFSVGHPVALDEEQFATLIREGMRRHGREVGKARQQVTHWHSFLNPLAHMIDASERMLFRARALEADLVKTRSHPVTSAEIQWHVEHHEANSMAASELAGCCLAVRMMAPVLAEMFVNLIIYNQYRGILPQNRDKDHYACQSILTRLKQLHAECDGFDRPVDLQAHPVAAFLDMMNRRNDLLHGNIQPANRKEDEFLVYEGIPIIKEFRSIYDRAIGPVINAFPLAEAERDYAAARGLLDYLLGCLEPTVAGQFKAMFDSLDLHQERNDRKLRTLFTNIFVESTELDNLYRLVGKP